MLDVELQQDLITRIKLTPANLRMARAYLNLTLNEISKMLDINSSTLSEYEKYADKIFNDKTRKLIEFYVSNKIIFNKNGIRY